MFSRVLSTYKAGSHSESESIARNQTEINCSRIYIKFVQLPCPSWHLNAIQTQPLKSTNETVKSIRRVRKLSKCKTDIVTIP